MKKNVNKAVFVAKKMFAQLVYDFQSLEGMPFTFPEVQTFLQGITIGGHKISDQDKLRQQQLAWQKLIELVEQEKFELSKEIACQLEYIRAKDETLTPGIIRDGAVTVTIGDFTYYPHDHSELPSLMAQTLANAKKNEVPLCDRGYQLSLDFAWNQFHWDGNKRTGNLMMNGLFLSNGVLPCSVPANRLLEYNQLLMEFYKNHTDGPLLEFLKACHKNIYNDWGMKYP